MAIEALSSARRIACWALLLVGCAGDAGEVDKPSCPAGFAASVPPESGFYRSVGEPGSPAPGADSYNDTEKRMTVDLAASTVEIVFLDRSSRRRVERYRIVR